MKVTFKNENEKGNIEEAGMRSLESTKEDIKQFALDELNEGESEFFEYGLSFSTVWVDDDLHPASRSGAAGLWGVNL